ncbi:hypothetical protein L3Q82_004816 [Scortum barcoo]|uniref:Uncharacterized protein n=1 Tax=Scortum barcoo TaxID=214431 RepID=A0ACB8VDT6_9TELE|nr:hypothetical protein L3Q82_004816 [Scortum barcoo]
MMERRVFAATDGGSSPTAAGGHSIRALVVFLSSACSDHQKASHAALHLNEISCKMLITLRTDYEAPLHISAMMLPEGTFSKVKVVKQQHVELNTIVPSKLVTKLRDLGLNSALCDWILNFLTGRPQAVRMGSTTSSTLTLNTGAPQGCVLSPLLYSLFTHDCVATHSSNTIIKFADDTTVIGLITGDNETALTSCCRTTTSISTSSKTKELIVDFRRRQREEHAPLSINGTTVERVNSFRFLGVHIREDLTWTHHTDFITKSARQRLFFLSRLRRLNMDSRILCSFYRCTIESILTGCITAWYSSCTALNPVYSDKYNTQQEKGLKLKETVKRQ